MGKIFEVEIRVRRKKLTTTSARALTRLDTYNWILFTSKNAVTFFAQELRERHISFPKKLPIAVVGPTTANAAHREHWHVQVLPEQFTVSDLLRSIGNIQGKHILFPRSAIAPYETIRKLRARGGHVTVLPLYNTEGMPINPTTKNALTKGLYKQLTFKSPSGIIGFMRQFSAAQRRFLQEVPALCIGPTTARAARSAGFKKILLLKI
jgi:uroporphyrinogen-III synthase